MERISTLNINTMSIGGALKSQADWAKAQLQQSSGLVSQDFVGLGTDSRTVLSLSREIEQSQTWASAATNAQARTEVMYSALGSMTSVMTDLRTTISAAISSPDNSTLLNSAQTLKDSLLSEMNKQYNGLYLFAGSNTDTAPVDITSYPSTSPYDVTVADTSYYTGDNTTLSVRISSEQTVSYGVTANNAAFEEALRAVEAVIQAASDTSLSSAGLTAALQSALTVANQATTDLANLQATISVSASSLKNAATEQTTYVTLLESSLSNVKDVDAAEVAVRVATLQTQLTASYSAVSDIAQMSLVKYL